MPNPDHTLGWGASYSRHQRALARMETVLSACEIESLTRKGAAMRAVFPTKFAVVAMKKYEESSVASPVVGNGSLSGAGEALRKRKFAVGGVRACIDCLQYHPESHWTT